MSGVPGSAPSPLQAANAFGKVLELLLGKEWKEQWGLRCLCKVGGTYIKVSEPGKTLKTTAEEGQVNAWCRIQINGKKNMKNKFKSIGQTPSCKQRELNSARIYGPF